MAPIVSTIEIARPPAEVFAYATDPARFPEWQEHIVGVEVSGTRFTTRRRTGGTVREATQEITVVDPPRRWAAHGIDGPIRPRVTIDVEPLRDGTWSRVTFSLDIAGHGMGRALVPMVARLAAQSAPVSYRNLKKRLEAGDAGLAG